jgi:hypothetical protein
MWMWKRGRKLGANSQRDQLGIAREAGEGRTQLSVVGEVYRLKTRRGAPIEGGDWSCEAGGLEVECSQVTKR